MRLNTAIHRDNCGRWASDQEIDLKPTVCLYNAFTCGWFRSSLWRCRDLVYFEKKRERIAISSLSNLWGSGVVAGWNRISKGKWVFGRKQVIDLLFYPESVAELVLHQMPRIYALRWWRRWRLQQQTKKKLKAIWRWELPKGKVTHVTKSGLWFS